MNSYSVLAKMEGQEVLTKLAKLVEELNDELGKETAQIEIYVNELSEMEDVVERIIFEAILQDRIEELKCKSYVLEGVAKKLKELFDELS